MNKKVVLFSLGVANKYKKAIGFKPQGVPENSTWVKEGKNFTAKILPSGTNVIYKNINERKEKIVILNNALIFHTHFNSNPSGKKYWISISKFFVEKLEKVSLFRTAPGNAVVKTDRFFQQKGLKKLLSFACDIIN